MATTTSLGISKPARGETGWHTLWNANADLLNGLLVGTSSSLFIAAARVGVGHTTATWGRFAAHENSATVATAALSQGNSSGNVLELNNGSSDLAGNLMVVTGAGKLGIGTTAPDALLHVEEGAGSFSWTPDAGTMAIIQRNASTGNGVALSLISGTGGDCALNFGDASLENDGALVYDQASNVLSFRVNAATRMTLNQDGKLGVNETTPDAMVDIVPTGTGVISLLVDTAASATAKSQEWHYNGSSRAWVKQTAAVSELRFDPIDIAGTVPGPLLYLDRNVGTEVGANTPAPGAVGFVTDANVVHYIWCDTGLLRMHTVQPTYNTREHGDEVGGQSSYLGAKNIIRQWGDPTDALEAVLDTGVYDFTYKDGKYNFEQFTGIVTDWAPWAGKEKTEDCPHGRQLNMVNVTGYHTLAIQALSKKIEDLERRLAS